MTTNYPVPPMSMCCNVTESIVSEFMIYFLRVNVLVRIIVWILPQIYTCTHLLVLSIKYHSLRMLNFRLMQFISVLLKPLILFSQQASFEE